MPKDCNFVKNRPSTDVLLWILQVSYKHLFLEPLWVTASDSSGQVLCPDIIIKHQDGINWGNTVEFIANCETFFVCWDNFGSYLQE